MQQVLKYAHLKDIDPAQRTVTAVLTVERPDLESDIVVADGVRFRTPLPMLRNHDPDQLLGTWDTPARTTVGGAPAWVARGVFGRSAVAQQAYEDVLDAHLSGCSIAFRVDEAAPRRDAPGQRFTRIWVSEASLTPTPACEACRVVGKALRGPAPAPLTLARATFEQLVRAELLRAVDAAMPSVEKHVKAAVLKLKGRVD